MKKIIAILTALAVVSMAFAQTVSITNTLSTSPEVVIDGAQQQWGFSDDNFLREEVVGTGTTADGRATVWGRARLDLETRDTENKSILNVKPHWLFTNELTAAALIKPLNGLEIKVGSHDGLNKYFGPGIEWENNNVGDIQIADVTGKWNGINGFRDGIYAGFTGIDGLWVGGGFVADSRAWNDGVGLDGQVWNQSGLIKKGAFGPIQLGATYDADLFGVGAKYVGQFGGYNDVAAKDVAKNGVDNSFTGKYNHHNIYAGFTFKGLQDAKVGTTIGAAVDFDTHSAAAAVGTKAYTAFAVSANAGMNFRNGITDTVAVTVAYQTIDGKKAKVLPFYIGNDLGYKVSDDASFSLHTSYLQGALINATKTYVAETTKDDVLSGDFASLITLKPAFNFSMGAHTFGFAVETQVANQIKYNQKTSADWAFTSMYGKKAKVKFPVSWSYNF
ncbi:MAG: hypothetical protein MJ196_12810 [Treponemataceae bacterium]|nr:hypothetical protein [Treponemataceae bacterium]